MGWAMKFTMGSAGKTMAKPALTTGVSKDEKHVVIHLPEGVTWIEMDPEFARYLAGEILRHAETAGK